MAAYTMQGPNRCTALLQGKLLSLKSAPPPPPPGLPGEASHPGHVQL